MNRNLMVSSLKIEVMSIRKTSSRGDISWYLMIDMKPAKVVKLLSNFFGRREGHGRHDREVKDHIYGVQ